MQTQSSKLIKVKNDTYAKLSELGKKSDTYDDIIRRLLEKEDRR
jgi:predicted CopG family antitoxin